MLSPIAKPAEAPLERGHADALDLPAPCGVLDSRLHLLPKVVELDLRIVVVLLVALILERRPSCGRAVAAPLMRGLRVGAPRALVLLASPRAAPWTACAIVVGC